MVCMARAGDREALRRLLERNWRWLGGLVWNLVGSDHDTDDVLQNVCVQVIGRIGQLREPERFRSWLAAIARNEALRWRKDRRHMAGRLDERAAEQAEAAAPAAVEQVVADEEAARMHWAIGQLPEKYREAFVLAYSDDLTHAQIGEILDVPVTTVQIRLVRARRMIHDLITTGISERIPRT